MPMNSYAHFLNSFVWLSVWGADGTTTESAGYCILQQFVKFHTQPYHISFNYQTRSVVLNLQKYTDQDYHQRIKSI